MTCTGTVVLAVVILPGRPRLRPRLILARNSEARVNQELSEPDLPDLRAGRDGRVEQRTIQIERHREVYAGDDDVYRGFPAGVPAALGELAGCPRSRGAAA